MRKTEKFIRNLAFLEVSLVPRPSGATPRRKIGEGKKEGGSGKTGTAADVNVGNPPHARR